MIFVKQGDTRPAAQKYLTRGTAVVDLTQAASVTFKMTRVGKVDLEVNSACVINDALTGDVEYRWAAGDTDNSGDYNAEFQVLWLDGTLETFPTLGHERVRISSDLDNA